MITQRSHLDIWMKKIFTFESQFQNRVVDLMRGYWQRDSRGLRKALKSSATLPPWYKTLSKKVLPPSEFTLQQFIACWPEDGWSEENTQNNLRILAELLELKERDGTPKDIKTVVGSLQQDLNRNGKTFENWQIPYERLCILWGIHRERILQKWRDEEVINKFDGRVA
jgi:hypothetical protein